MTTKTFEAILDRALLGYELSPAEGVVLLRQTDPGAIAAIRNTADQLRYQQAGDTVTYVINRNINFTNICEQHCSFCAPPVEQSVRRGVWGSWIRSRSPSSLSTNATPTKLPPGLQHNPGTPFNFREASEAQDIDRES